MASCACSDRDRFDDEARGPQEIVQSTLDNGVSQAMDNDRQFVHVPADMRQWGSGTDGGHERLAFGLIPQDGNDCWRINDEPGLPP